MPTELNEILKNHHTWIETCGEEGARAELQGANLRDANLLSADLQGANLRDANLRGADLRGAILRGADLQRADLRSSYLWGAILRGADLQGANLRRSYLRGADLRGANLRGADLRGAELRSCVGNGKEVRSLQVGPHAVAYTKHEMAIGCMQHTLKKWSTITKDKIKPRSSGELFERHMPWLLETISRFPAD